MHAHVQLDGPPPSSSSGAGVMLLDEAGRVVPPDPATVVVQVFRDWTSRRWRRLCIAAGVFCLLALTIGGVFVRKLRMRVPANESLQTPLPFDLAKVAARAKVSGHASPAAFVQSDGVTPAHGVPALASAAPFRERLAWVDPGEDGALRSLDAHAADLTAVVIPGLHVDGAKGQVSSTASAEVIATARSHHLQVYETLDDERDGAPRAADVTAVGRDLETALRFGASVRDRARRDGVDGVVIELSDDAADPDDEARIAIAHGVRDAFAKSGSSPKPSGAPGGAEAGGRLLAVLAVGPGIDAATLRTEAAIYDRVFVRAHLAPDDFASPLPVAPRRWLGDAVAALSALVPVDKLVVSLPTRAATWPVRAVDLTPAGQPALMSWSDVVTRARLSGVRPAWDDETGSLFVALPGSSGVASSTLVLADSEEDADVALVAWMPDAVTFAEGAEVLRANGVQGIGVDDLGGEDPRVWRVLAANASDRPGLVRALATIPRGTEWNMAGQGVELRVLTEEKDGSARVGVAGALWSESYEALPATITVAHRGKVPTKAVSLTFDDGPDAEFTPKVLDILKRQGVLATFFVIGSRVEREPELLRRVAAEGHELGNHSFSHADLSKITEHKADLEISSTNLLLQATAARSTVLFRPPYRADDMPSEMDDILSVAAGQRNGVSTIGSTVDPRDWDETPSAAIIDIVVSRVALDNGGVVLLHDGGGDRSRTVAALEPMIVALRAKGFRFVQVRDIFGGRPMALVNPPMANELDQPVSKLIWWSGTWSMRFMRSVALVALILGLLRVLTLVVGALLDIRKHGREGKKHPTSAIKPRVSVVVPSYNEAKVIQRTVSSVLASEGIDVEVIVLDDGSRDNTGDIVASVFAQDKRVRLIRLANGGKARALNIGFREASHDIVVALDADTIFLPNTIADLAEKFLDEKVGAVAGRAVVGNTKSVIGRWQALEYVVGQAVERRAWHLLGLVSVVPGAVGAWRKQAVLDAGGFARDTLAEDSDLTIDLQLRGWKVEYASSAVALTEAPETARALVKQRFRWSYGVLQALWKHRRAALRSKRGNRRVGLLLLPTVLVSHLATPLFAPAGDLAAIVAIYLGFGQAVVPYAVATVVADFALTAFAMRLDRAKWSLAYDWLIYRAAYRWLLFFALARAVLTAARGGAVGWGKLVRKGTVRVAGAELARP